MSSADLVMEGAKCKELRKVIIGSDEKKFFQVGDQLPPQKKEVLIEFLMRNVDVFAWSAYENSRLDPNFICHHLNVNPSIIPQKATTSTFI